MRSCYYKEPNQCVSWQVSPLCCEPFSWSTCATNKIISAACFCTTVCLFYTHAGSFCKCDRLSLWFFTLPHCERLHRVWESTVSTSANLVDQSWSCVLVFTVLLKETCSTSYQSVLTALWDPRYKMAPRFHRTLILTNKSLPHTELVSQLRPTSTWVWLAILVLSYLLCTLPVFDCR